MDIRANSKQALYKRKNKYGLSDDARSLRAIERKRDQKNQRYGTHLRHRIMSTPHYKNEHINRLPTNNSAQKKSVKKYTKKELEELGRARYENMLKWKEQKRKLLEKEKQKRKPHFKTPVYKPDAPKFLSGSDMKENKNSVTICKSAAKGSKTPLAPSRVNKVSKPLKFVTPKPTPGIMDSRVKTKLCTSSSSRVARVFRPPPNDLGVAPLPLTPNVLPLTRSKKFKSSFAPANFVFEASKIIKNIETNSNRDNIKSGDYNYTSIENEGDSEQHIEENEGVSEQHIEENVAQDENATEFTSKISEVEKTENFLIKNTEINNEHDNGSDHNSENSDIDKNIETDDNGSDHNSENNDIDKNIETDDISEEDNNKFINEDSRKSRKRVSTVSKKEIPQNITPTLFRLRPRSSCSRSTRRSRSVHCDHVCLESLLTPRQSAKKKPKKSVTKAAQLSDKNEVVEMDFLQPEFLNVSKTDSEFIQDTPSANESPFKTPISRFLKKTPFKKRSRISPLLDTNPWINKSRGSSSASRKKRLSIFNNELEVMFNDIPLDGSLPPKLMEEFQPLSVGASPILDSCRVQSAIVIPSNSEENDSFKENVTSKSSQEELKDLLTLTSSRSLNKHDTPVICVWGNDSPDISATVLNEEESNKEGAPMVEINDRRRTTVTFDTEIDDKEKVKYPATPVKRSHAKVSLGIFSQIIDDDNSSQEISPEEDLMKFDSPAPIDRNSRRSYAKMADIKVIHEMDFVPENEETESSVVDEKSNKAKGRRTSKISVQTPVRRSRRISQTPARL